MPEIDYTWPAVTSAFAKTYDEDGNAIDEGYDYQTANELLKRIADTGEGRVYIERDGKLVYESRYHRDA